MEIVPSSGQVFHPKPIEESTPLALSPSPAYELTEHTLLNRWSKRRHSFFLNLLAFSLDESL